MVEYIFTLEGRKINDEDHHWGLLGIFSTEERANKAMDNKLNDPLWRMLGHEYKIERAVMDEEDTTYQVPRDENGNNIWSKDSKGDFLDNLLINGDVPLLVRKEKTVPLDDDQVQYHEVDEVTGFWEFKNLDKDDPDPVG